MKSFLIVFSIICSFSWAQAVDFISRPATMGRASMTSNSFYEKNILGVANFSSELRFPVQLIYNSEVRKSGLFGYSWTSPQLESSSIPKKDGVVWTTPWGEKIDFVAKETLNKDEKQIFGEELKGGGKYFAPYSQWEANTTARKDRRASSGNWTFTGKGDYKGWSFSYRGSRLFSIDSPNGRSLDFVYDNDSLVAVSQNGSDFITLSYNDDGHVSQMTVNGTVYAFSYESADIKIPPSTLHKPDYSTHDVALLESWQKGELNPVKYGYDEQGYLASICQGERGEQLTVQNESLDQRLQTLKAQAKQTEVVNGKEKRIYENQAISGRLLADDNYQYKYHSRSVGRVDLINNAGQKASNSYNAQTGVAVLTGFSGKKQTSYYYRRYDVAYMGKLRQTVDHRNRTTSSYRYDNHTGKLIRYTDIAGNDINYDYDGFGNLASVSIRGSDDAVENPWVKMNMTSKATLSK